MPGTNAVAVKVELDTRLRARPGLAGVQIVYSDHEQKVVDRERIAFGETRFAQERSASSGATRVPRNELARIKLLVHVRFLGRTPQEADLRAAAIGREVEEELADDASLGRLNGTVASVRVAGGELAHVLDADGGVLSQLEYDLVAESHYIR